ncbi:TPA: hypothetical protein DCZ16_04305 [Candidatus Peregrinibacteria bacterium]|nr:hypothetical protein [Candidatus Peregrinibacteria bacterium]
MIFITFCNMIVEDILTNIGLNIKQIYVFMALLELGSQPVSIVAKKTNLNRTTLYPILAELIKLGFVSKFNKLNIQYFSPVSPEDLVDVIKRKKEEFSRLESEMRNVLPDLRARFNPYMSKSSVGFFEGIQGVKNVLDDVANSKDEILAYRCVDSWITGQASEIVKDFDARCILKKNKMKMIVMDSAISRVYFSDIARKNIEFKLKKMKFENEIYIYENKIASISFISGSMFGAIIESNENSKTQKAVFYLGWK